MRQITARQIQETIAGLCIEANTRLRPDVLAALKAALKIETNGRAKRLLGAIIENARTAKKTGLAICQDTGLPVVFVELGQGAQVSGGLLIPAINKGIESGYKNGSLRNSVVLDPVLRGAPKYAPAVIHTEIVKGDRLKLTVLPKGFGSENKAQVKMFKPTAGIGELEQFIVGAVREAGPDACPPFVVGVGIGGTQDYACLLAKKALMRSIQTPHLRASILTPHLRVGNIYYTRKSIVQLEKELLLEINHLGIGPMGLGGRTTALAVNVETFPTHIAGLPVAVNISCHALRTASAVI